MKKDLCELIVVIDESGSMGSVRNDTIGGFNTFLETHQKMPGEAKLTLVKFDTKYDIVHNGLDIQKTPPLNSKTYSPSGMTALLDAVGKTIDAVGKRLDATPEEEKPEKVIMVIMTDGEENSSREYKIEDVKRKMKHQQDVYKWDVVFMGADQDAWAAGGGMGVSNNVNYTVKDTGKMFKAAAYYSSNSRGFSSNTSMDNFSLSEDDLDKELNKIKDTPKQ